MIRRSQQMKGLLSSGTPVVQVEVVEVDGPDYDYRDYRLSTMALHRRWH